MTSPVTAGIYFGLSSGIITILGLMTGLNASTQSTAAVLGGIIIIAIADSLSDSFGIHISKEAEHRDNHREVWAATIATFFSKMLIASSFAVPILLLPLQQAIHVSIAWGLLVLTILSFFLARSQQRRPLPIIAEHNALAILVIVLTHFIGTFIGKTFA